MAHPTRFDILRTIHRIAGVIFLVAVASASLSAQTAPAFQFRSFLGKCLDHSPDPNQPAVFLSKCNGAQTQQIVVAQLMFLDSVVLHVGSKCIGTLANVTVARIPLQVQDCGGRPKRGPFFFWQPVSQTFKWDGDSLVSAADPSLVVEPQDGSAANGTPLVLGRRDLRISSSGLHRLSIIPHGK